MTSFYYADKIDEVSELEQKIYFCSLTNKNWLDEYDIHLKKVKSEYNIDLNKYAEERKFPPAIMAMEFPFVERHLQVITENHIAGVDTDMAIYA